MKNILFVDTETTGLNPNTDEIRLISYCKVTEEEELKDSSFKVQVADVWENPDKIREFGQIFQTSDTIVGHNLYFDLLFLEKYGIKPSWRQNLWDSRIASQVLFSEEESHSLQALVDRVLGIKLDKTMQKSNWSTRYLSPKQLEYAALDCKILIKLYKAISKLFDAKPNSYRTFLRDCRVYLATVLAAPVKIDTEKWKQNCLKWKQSSEQLAEEIGSLLEIEADLFGDKTEAVAKILRSPYKLINHLNKFAKKNGLTKNGKLQRYFDGTTSIDNLSKYNENRIIQLIIRYRELEKRLSAFGISWLDKYTYKNFLKCRSFNACLQSGRMAYSEPNIQQIPAIPEFRYCFVADDSRGKGREKGSVIIKSDYSQIELRICAEVTEDEKLIKAYQNGEDVHSQTARIIVGRVDKEARQAAKAVNFGLIYGMGSRSLAEYCRIGFGINISESVAKEWKQKFFAEYQGVAEWLASLPKRFPIDSESKNLIVHSLSRTRNIHPKECQFRYPLSTVANTLIQSVAADGLKNAIILMHNRKKEELKYLFSVHDEIVCETPEEEIETSITTVKQSMIDGMRTYIKQVPVIVETKIGKSWC